MFFRVAYLACGFALLGVDVVRAEPPLARVELLDGAIREVPSFRAGDADEFLSGTDHLPRDSVRRIWLSPRSAALETPRSSVTLAHGGRIGGRSITVADDECVIVREGETTIRVPLQDVQSLRLHEGPSLPSFLAAATNPHVAHDQIFLRVDEAPTAINGFLEAVSAESVTLEWMNEVRTVPLEKLYGVVFAAAAGKRDPPRYWIDLHDGSRLPATSCSLDVDAEGKPRFQVGMKGDDKFALPWSDVRAVQFVSDRIQSLAAQGPSASRDRPIAAFPRSWRKNRSVGGRPLRAGSDLVEEGFGVQSGTTLEFTLEEGWTDFTVTVALDPDDGSQGNCEFVIRGDGRELVRQPIRGGDAGRAIRADIRGITRLELFVDYGENLDLGDHANWCEPMLIRRN